MQKITNFFKTVFYAISIGLFIGIPIVLLIIFCGMTIKQEFQTDYWILGLSIILYFVGAYFISRFYTENKTGFKKRYFTLLLLIVLYFIFFTVFLWTFQLISHNVGTGYGICFLILAAITITILSKRIK